MDSVDLASRLVWKLMLPSAFGNPSFFLPLVQYYLQKWSEYGNTREPKIGAGWHEFLAGDSQGARAARETRYRA